MSDTEPPSKPPRRSTANFATICPVPSKSRRLQKPLPTPPPTQQKAQHIVFDPLQPPANLVFGRIRNFCDFARVELVSRSLRASAKRFGWSQLHHLDLAAVVRSVGKGANNRRYCLTFRVLDCDELSQGKALSMLRVFLARVANVDALSLAFSAPESVGAKRFLEQCRRKFGELVHEISESVQRRAFSLVSVRLTGLGHDDRLTAPGALLPCIGVRSSVRHLYLNPILSKDAGPQPQMDNDDEQTIYWSCMESVSLWQRYSPQQDRNKEQFLQVIKLLIKTVFFSRSDEMTVTVGWLDNTLVLKLIVALLNYPEVAHQRQQYHVRQQYYDLRDIWNIVFTRKMHVKLFVRKQNHSVLSGRVLIYWLSKCAMTALPEGTEKTVKYEWGITFKYRRVTVDVAAAPDEPDEG